MQTGMLNNIDTYMELIVFFMLWGFSSCLPSREKHPAHCTTKTTPEKATDQILHSQENVILSLLSGCAVDISLLNIFFIQIGCTELVPPCWSSWELSTTLQELWWSRSGILMLREKGLDLNKIWRESWQSVVLLQRCHLALPGS